jgi:hypothetical protein
MIAYLILSGIIVNSVHGYLLWSQLDERKRSISAHAVKNRQTYTIYLLGHLTAGSLFAIFSYDFFVNTHDLRWLFWIVCAGVAFEYVQAALPARGKTDGLHSITAYAMFISYAFVAFFSMLVLPLSSAAWLLAAPFILFIAFSGVLAVRNRSTMYPYQMVAIGSFSIVIIIIALGSHD